jgi:hypothetical protein
MPIAPHSALSARAEEAAGAVGGADLHALTFAHKTKEQQHV